MTPIELLSTAWTTEDAATSGEYALLASLVTGVVAIAVGTFSDQVSALWTNASTTLDAVIQAALN